MGRGITNGSAYVRWRCHLRPRSPETKVCIELSLIVRHSPFRYPGKKQRLHRKGNKWIVESFGGKTFFSHATVTSSTLLLPNTEWQYFFKGEMHRASSLAHHCAVYNVTKSNPLSGGHRASRNDAGCFLRWPKEWVGGSWEHYFLLLSGLQLSSRVLFLFSFFSISFALFVGATFEWNTEPQLLLSSLHQTNELLFCCQLSCSCRNRSTYLNEYLPWAIRVGTTSSFLMNVYYERRWEQDITELRDELKIETPPGIL